MEQLQKEIKELRSELEFMKKIFDHPSACVYQMERASKDNKPVWINVQMISVPELEALDPSERIDELINEKKHTRYSDKW